uniref:Krueppel-like factor 17 n=1 Tax=Otolemur garnettii TaxID=30611 RepID=H0XMD6_OTOGA
MCSGPQAAMEQEIEDLSQWPVAHPSTQGNEKLISLDMTPASGNSGELTFWNHGVPGIQHFTGGREISRSPWVSAEALRQNVNEVGPRFSTTLHEPGMGYCPQATPTHSPMTYCQGVSPSQPEMMVFKGTPMMPLGVPNVTGVAMTFTGHLRMSSTGLPVSNSSGRMPMMSHMGAPGMPYSEPSTAPSNRASLTPEILLAPTTPATEVMAVLPSLEQMLPPRDPHNHGISPAETQSLLALESQDSIMSQPDSQAGSFLPEQPYPAPQKAEPNSGAQEGVYRCRSSAPRPYRCPYENCGKAYTKRSHLVTHQRKHTGERPYKCSWEGCILAFYRSDELARHTRIHTRYRPYKCDHCGRKFMRSDHLRQHRKIHQQRPGPSDPQVHEREMGGPPPDPA